eukprot:3866716-Prymnesium_polylepis.1
MEPLLLSARLSVEPPLDLSPIIRRLLPLGTNDLRRMPVASMPAWPELRRSRGAFAPPIVRGGESLRRSVCSTRRS